MGSSPGSDQHDEKRIAHEIATLYQAVLAFREFLGELSPHQRGALAEGLPWSEEGAEIWLDFQAWVHVTQTHLQGSERQRRLR